MKAHYQQFRKHNFFKTILLFLAVVALAGCNKDDGLLATTASDVTLTGISPTKGARSTEVMISGSNFGNDYDEVLVFFNGVEAIVKSLANSVITVIVPDEATSGKIKIIIRDKEVTGSFNYTVTEVRTNTLAGSIEGFANGMGSNAQFNSPTGVAVDAQGNVYVADKNNHKIRKIAPNGEVSTFAGSTQGFTNGTGPNAQFYGPTGIAVDKLGNVYVADQSNHKIRKITLEGLVSTLAGGTPGFADGIGNAAQFDFPAGVAVDAIGNVYVADWGNHKIRKITPDGAVSTIAGSIEGYADGMGSDARFSLPTGIAVDDLGNLYVGDWLLSKIRKITSSGLVSTLAGGTKGFANGTGTEARFNGPAGLVVDAKGNINVADEGNHKIRKISPDGNVSSLVGSVLGFSDGTGAEAQLNYPVGVAIDLQGNIYIADTENHRIRKISQE